MGLTNNKLFANNQGIFFIPSGSNTVNAISAGTTASFVVTMSGLCSTGSSLVANADSGTGSHWSLMAANSDLYKIWYLSSSLDGIEPNIEGLPYTSSIDRSRSIPVLIEGTDRAQQIAEKTKIAIQNRPSLSRVFIVSCSSDEKGGTEGYHFFIYNYASGSKFASTHATESSIHIDDVIATGSSTRTWNSQSIDDGTGTYPGIAYEGDPVFASSSFSLSITGSTNTDTLVQGFGDSGKIFISSSGKIGINNTTPERAFDITDDTAGEADIAVKKSKASGDIYEVGTEIGSLKFIATSQSFEDESTGSLAEVKTSIAGIQDDGRMSGKLSFNTWRVTGESSTNIMNLGYGILGNAPNHMGVEIIGAISQSSLTSDKSNNIRATKFFGNVSSSSGFTGSFKGNADTATALATARTIGGTSFNGTSNIVPSTVNITTDTGNADHYLTYVDSSGTQQLKVDAGLSYNPSTNVLTLNGMEISFDQESNQVKFSYQPEGSDREASVTLSMR